MRSIGKPHLLAALICTVAAVPALAQDQPGAYPPGCEPSKVSKTDIERAHTVFLSGKQYIEESNYDKAISYFKDAYSIDCSVHGILPIIATAYERKGDKAEAVRALEEYLRRAPNSADHEVIERRIKNLKDQMARDQPVALPSATAAVTVSTAASSSADTSVPVAPTPPPVAASATAAEPEAPHRSVLPWVVVGLGGAAVVAGVVLAAVGAGDISSAEQQCGASHDNCLTQAQVSQGNSGRTLEPLGIGVAIGGAAAVVAGLLWRSMEPTAPATATRVRPSVTPGYAGVAMIGSF